MTPHQRPPPYLRNTQSPLTRAHNPPPSTIKQKLLAFRGGSGQHTPGSPERKPSKYKSVKESALSSQLNIKDLCVRADIRDVFSPIDFLFVAWFVGACYGFWNSIYICFLVFFFFTWPFIPTNRAVCVSGLPRRLLLVMIEDASPVA